MKLLILTTQTTHHTKFVRDIANIWPNTKAVIETRSLTAPFETSHEYLDKQNEYEKDLWFDGSNPQIKDMVDTIEVENINDEATQTHIKDFQPNLIIVFGTGKILPAIINLAPNRIMNLHGGDPEEYRGLDTHLWAIYHNELDQLITCLHAVAPALDTGDIIEKQHIKIKQGMKLHHLRAQNTQCCIDLVKNAVQNFEKYEKLKTFPQKTKGRYYSFMPSVLKNICVKKFERYTNDIA